MTSNYTSFLSDSLFPSFISSCVPNINLNDLKEEAYLIQDKEKSIDSTNQGGYHSPAFTGEIKYKHLNKLAQITREFAQDVADYHHLNVQLSNLTCWVNINKEYDYNVLHDHYRADLIGCYYISLKENSGDLVVIRNDGSNYGSLYKNRLDLLAFDLKAQTGRLYLIPGQLWHYVMANKGQDDRISVAFNIYF